MTKEKIMKTRFPQLSLAIALGAALALPLLAEDVLVADKGTASVTGATGTENNDQENSGTPAALILLNNENK